MSQDEAADMAMLLPCPPPLPGPEPSPCEARTVVIEVKMRAVEKCILRSE